MSQEEAKYAHHNQRKILNTQCVTKYRLFVVLFNFQVMGLSCWCQELSDVTCSEWLPTNFGHRKI